MLTHPNYTATLCGRVFGPKGLELSTSSIDGCGYKKFNATDQALGKRVTVKAHRFVWEYFNGPIPDGLQIDHINRDKTDNRLVNLRAVTHLENMMNRPDYGMSPEERITRLGDIGGIYLQKKSGNFYVNISLGGVLQYIGSYKTVELARVARDAAIHMQQE